MQLPFSWPVSETYQSASLVMGVLLSHENISKLYDNNYIHVFCKHVDSMWDVNLQFWGVSWEDFRLSGIFEMNLYHLNLFSETSFNEFVKERLVQENYILLHFIDEFFLPYSGCYQRKHFIHDAYIIGFEDEFYYVLAYSDRKLQILKVLKTDIWNALTSCYDFEKEVYFCSLRPNHAVEVKTDYNKMRNDFLLYLGKESSDNRSILSEDHHSISVKSYTPKFVPEYIYGIHCYDEIIRVLELTTSEDVLDIRPFRLLWEHKTIITERITKICDEFNLVNVDLNAFDQITAKAKLIFTLAIKYKMVKTDKLKDRIINHIRELKENEEEALNSFINEWTMK